MSVKPKIEKYNAKFFDLVCDFIDIMDSDDLENVKKFINDRIKIDESFNINSEDSEGRLPLVIACAAKNINMVNFLIEKGADVNLKSKGGLWPLLRATTIGSVEIVKRLLRAPGIEVDQTNIVGNTPLMALCSRHELTEDHKIIIKLLIKAGAKTDLTNRDGKVVCASKLDSISSGSSSPKKPHKGGKTNKRQSIKRRKTVQKRS
jgi:ankyrin repeat protein